MKLVQVQVFFRHGARTPLHHVRSPCVGDAFWTPELAVDVPHTLFPIQLTDLCTKEHLELSDISSLPVPCKLPGGLRTGDLITHGQEEAYQLGVRLKETYINGEKFISRLPFDGSIWCRSTRILRTVKSMRCVTAGLFGESLSENKTNMKLPVYVEMLNREFLFPNKVACEQMCEFSADGAIERRQSYKHNLLKKELKKILGVDHLVDDLHPTPDDCPIYYVRDDYSARVRAGFPIPPGLEKVIPLMDELSCDELYWEFIGKQSQWDENTLTVMGPVFRMILCNMQNYENIPKFHLYSCHDSTVMLLLYALGCFDGRWSPFCADLIFELYVDEECASAKQNDSTPQADRSSPTSIEHLDSQLDALWIRILYLGNTQNLGCLWKAPVEDVDKYNAGYVPLRRLMERWSSVGTQGPVA